MAYKHYLRSTRNLYYIEEKPGVRIYYSYVTPVAFLANGVLKVSENRWSVTTGRHLTWIDGGAKKDRLPHDQFKKELEDIKGQQSKQPDILKTVSAVSALFGIISDHQKDKEGKVKFQKRFFEKVPGIQFPEDWDQLPTEEKEKRLKKVTEEGLKKRWTLELG